MKTNKIKSSRKAENAKENKHTTSCTKDYYSNFT